MTNVLLGGAIYDALGVFAETKLANYQPLIDWDGKTFLGSEHHGLNPGQFSDDGQMQQMVANSLIENNGFNPDDLSARYMDWFFSGRARGFGTTTKLAMQNLQSGKHWSESGIAESYGNGTAMRSAPFGVYFRDDINLLIKNVKIDSAITHASNEAEAGAISIALAAAYATNNDLDNLIEKIWLRLPDSKVKNTIYSLETLVNSKYITTKQALNVLGTKADVRETVPSVIYMFLKFGNCHKACETIIRAGGDTDSCGSILGALFGAKDGIKNIPSHLIEQVEDSKKLIELDVQLYNRSNRLFFPRN